MLLRTMMTHLMVLMLITPIKTVKANPLHDYIAGYIRTNGVWILETGSNEEGLPTRWVQNYRWGPGQSSALVDSFAQFADGSCELYWHTTYRWDANAKIISVAHLGQGHAYMTGTGSLLDAHQGELILQGTFQDGSPGQFRDIRSIKNPDQYWGQAYEWNRETEGWERSESEPVIWNFVDEKICNTGIRKGSEPIAIKR